ncbi:MAG TPA: helicase C-terminal domain-containing protein [Opitutaceae bacterium]|nr:helicase C-terminal domain-containing protein [Opitutaceae bacterium]
MDFDLEQRTARLGVGEFASFTLGPREGGDGQAGIWRAQLGTHWHRELRAQTAAEHATAEFEVAIEGRIFHRGWTLAFNGRIDQLLRSPPPPPPPPPPDASGTCHLISDMSPGRASAEITLREIKTVTQPLPADEAALRADYPEYFVQIATYAALSRLGLATVTPGLTSEPPKSSSGICHLLDDKFPGAAPKVSLRVELVFVEAGSGLAQTVRVTPADDALFHAQLDRITEFLDLRHEARERLRRLSFRPAFAALRPGQETTRAELTSAFERQPAVLFEAPTGFGKTGLLLEFALGQLRSGHFERVLYLTSKSTGQLQVVRTLSGMTAEPPRNAAAVESQELKVARPDTPSRSAAAVERPKLKVEGTEDPPPRAAPVGSQTLKVERTEDPAGSPLSTFNSQLSTATDVAAEASVAVWHVRNKGEHCVNHTFHCVRENCAYLDGVAARWAQSGLSRFYRFENQARDLETLRSAGREVRICPYEITRAALAFNDVWVGDYNYVFAPNNRALFYHQPGFDPARSLLILDEAHNLPSRVADAYSHSVRADDARALLAELDHLHAPAPLVRAWESWALLLSALPVSDALDPALEADVADTVQRISDQLAALPLDYAALGPNFAAQIWQVPQLAEWLGNSDLKKLLWSPRAAELHFTCIDAADAIGATLRAFGGVVFASATLSPVDAFAESCGLTPATPHAHLRAHTPWRDTAYDVAVDARVDTRFQQRAKHHATTAATVAALHEAARGPVAVFFPSYAYAETIARELDRSAPGVRVALQPKLRDLAAQSAWVEESLALSDALFLVLGSSFAESIDALGGRVTHAMIVGPALPEVNAVQRARLAEFSALGREAAFRRVYQIPGMAKVNQALGRLVRAPGQRARVILHCQRFLDPTYANLLAPEYQFGVNVLQDADLAAWLARG